MKIIHFFIFLSIPLIYHFKYKSTKQTRHLQSNTTSPDPSSSTTNATNATIELGPDGKPLPPKSPTDKYKPRSPYFKPQKCPIDLLKSFNLTTFEMSIDADVPICGLSGNSCCLPEDQQKLIDLFTKENLQEKLTAKFKIYNQAIDDFFLKVKEIEQASDLLLSNKQAAPRNECYYMARRIINYKGTSTYYNIQFSIKQMQEFITSSLKGVWCSLCNGLNAQFIDVSTKTISISHKFCRDIIENSLHNIIYYQVSFPKYAQLLSTFITTCNNKGEFDQAKIVPQDALMQFKSEEEKKLALCLKYRNSDIWVQVCKDICLNFNLANISDQFKPNTEILGKITGYLDKTIKEFNGLGKPVAEGQTNTTDTNTTANATSNAITQLPKRFLITAQNKRKSRRERVLSQKTRKLQTQAAGLTGGTTDAKPEEGKKQEEVKLDPQKVLLFTQTPEEQGLKNYKTDIKIGGIDFLTQGYISEYSTQGMQGIASEGVSAQQTAKNEATKTRRSRKLKEARILGILGMIVIGLLSL